MCLVIDQAQTRCANQGGVAVPPRLTKTQRKIFFFIYIKHVVVRVAALYVMRVIRAKFVICDVLSREYGVRRLCALFHF